MTPFFSAINSTLGVMLIFAIAIIGGNFISSRMAKEKDGNKLTSTLFALIIFVLIFFASRQ